MKTLLVLGSSIAALVAVLALAAGASAFENTIPFTPGNPLVNGCPAGFEAIQVSDFPVQYRVPARLDNPANGGNGDGTVCGKPLTPQEQAAQFPNENVLIFNFRDNTLTPSH
jgi:hypothetical protein